MRTIALVGAKGGVGKTTLSINLAAAAAAAGKRVLVLGLRRDVGDLTGVSLPIWSPGLPVVPVEAPVPGLAAIAAELESSPQWVHQPLQHRLRDIHDIVDGAGVYDVAILDAPPDPTVMGTVAAAVDHVVCAMSPTSSDRAATVELIERVREHSPNDGALPDIWGVVTQVFAPRADTQRIAAATKGVPVRWATQPIRYSASYDRTGEPYRNRVFIPVLDCSRTARPVVDINALADELGLLH